MRLTENQKNQCHLCGNDFENKTRKFLDHNHATGEPRKLLCYECNTQLALYERYTSIDILIELENEQVKFLHRKVAHLKELKNYIERGECTPHIMKHKNWPGLTRVSTTMLIPFDELYELNILSHISNEYWIFIREHLRQAARECITLLHQQTERAKP